MAIREKIADRGPTSDSRVAEIDREIAEIVPEAMKQGRESETLLDRLHSLTQERALLMRRSSFRVGRTRIFAGER